MGKNKGNKNKNGLQPQQRGLAAGKSTVETQLNQQNKVKDKPRKNSDTPKKVTLEEKSHHDVLSVPNADSSENFHKETAAIPRSKPRRDSDTPKDLMKKEEKSHDDVLAVPNAETFCDNWEDLHAVTPTNPYMQTETKFNKEFKPKATFSQGKNKSKSKHLEAAVKFTMSHIDGDLFDAPQGYSFAHCVAQDMAMGAGIAVRFRKMFSGSGELLDQNAKVGGVAFLHKKERFVYYLITKTHSSKKPTMNSLKSSLLELKKMMELHNVKKLAMPEIGCGLDRLDWNNVEILIKDIFSDTDVHIQVYHYKEEIADSVTKQEKKPFTPRIKNTEILLKDMQYNTARFFLCCENDDITPEITSFNEKYMIINEYRSAKRMMGEVVRIKIHRNDNFYGLVCRKSLKHPISFMTLEKCMDKFNFYNKEDQYEYLGIQAFEEKGNDIVVDQVINIIKNCTKSPCYEIWVCWPQNLKSKCVEFQASAGIQ